MAKPLQLLRRSRPLAIYLLPLLLLVFAGCSRDAPMNFLHPEGPVARQADHLWRITFGLAAGVFILVEGALVFIILRFRHKHGDHGVKQVHGNTRLEIMWTLIPFLLLTGVAIPTVKGVFELYAEPKGDVLPLKVVAHQWWWEVKYEESGVVTANELHIPVNRPVRITLQSIDVIHSFWVPKLAGKQDVVPGRLNRITLIAEKPDVYLGQCAEYCGLSHANMRLKVFAETQSDFDAWIASQKADASVPTAELAAQGGAFFENGPCAGCHTVGGTKAQGLVGPNLTHFASRTTFAGSMFERTDENLALWLKNPQGRKPGSRMPNLHLGDSDIQALVAYLQSLN